MSEAADQEQAHLSCPTCMATYRGGFETCPVDGAVLAPATVDPLVGITIADQYVIDKCVGEGAMGRVYLAHHARLTKRKFAMKVLLGDLAADPTMRLRFAQEAEAASRLQHPNVVPVLDFGKTEGGLHYLVMDFIEGGTLSDLIERGALSEKEAIEIGKQICQGLTHAHEQGLVHRDFKPDNVALVQRDGKSIPQILDFGLAIISTPEESSVRLTSAGLVVGTPAYVSPEQCQAKPVDEGTDLFALGVSLYEMVSGVLPFDGSVIDLLYKNATVQAPGILERSGIQVSPQLEAIIMKLMAKARSDRFADAREVLAALEAIQSPSDTVVRAVGGAVANPADKVKLESARTMVASPGVESEGMGAAAAANTVSADSAGEGSWGGVPKGALLGGALLLLGGAALAAVLMMGGGDQAAEAPTGPPVVQAAATNLDAGAIAEEAPTPVAVPDAGSVEVAVLPPDAALVAKAPVQKEPRSKGRRTKRPRIKNSKVPVKPEIPVTKPPPPVEKPKPPVPPPPPPVKEPVAKPPAVRPKPPVKPPVVKPKVPTSFQVGMELASFSSRGSLSKSVTTRAVNRGKSALKKCYEKTARAAKKNAAMTVTIKFTLNEQGRASKVKVSGASKIPGLKRCIEGVVKKVKSTTPPDTGTQSVQFVLKYKPKQ